MTLLEFKQHIESFPEGHIFQYGISAPFSWRGSYDEVAFSLIDYERTREEILSNIDRAYSDIFEGYKGGEYRYNNDTNVNFESDYGDYTDLSYTIQWIARIEGKEGYKSASEHLIKVAFK